MTFYNVSNPCYKKIWGKVIMNRHPEANSLGLSLSLEMTHDGCYYYAGDSLNMTSISVPLGRNILNEKAIQGHTAPWLTKDSFITILGRPITIEDVLLLCRGYFAGINIDVNGIFKFNAIGEPANWSIIPWQFTKPLHEQTPKTWEKIAELI